MRVAKPKLIRMTRFLKMLDISRRTYYRLKDQPGFPKPFRISPTSPMAFIEGEVIAYICSGRADAQLAELSTRGTERCSSSPMRWLGLSAPA